MTVLLNLKSWEYILFSQLVLILHYLLGHGIVHRVGFKSTYDVCQNMWKCGELEVYFSPSAGG